MQAILGGISGADPPCKFAINSHVNCSFAGTQPMVRLLGKRNSLLLHEQLISRSEKFAFDQSCHTLAGIRKELVHRGEFYSFLGGSREDRRR